jgi:hypothetical protein
MKRLTRTCASVALGALVALGFAHNANAQYSNAITVQRAFVVPANAGSYSEVHVACPAGHVALSGGVENVDPDVFEITILAPTFSGVALFAQADGTRSAADGWYAGVINYDRVPRAVTVTAVCAPVTGVVVEVGTASVTAVAGNAAGSGFLAVACPAGTVALGGGVDVSRPEAMKMISSSPWYASGGTFLTNRTPGLNPAPVGWAGLTSNQGTNAGTMKVGAVCGNVGTVVSIVSAPAPVRFAEHNIGTVMCPAGYIATGGGFDSNDPHALIGTFSTPIHTGYAFPVDRGDGQYGAAAGWSADTFSHSQSGTKNLTVGVICLGIDFAPPGTFVIVYEFYNTNLKHYFRTSSLAEANAIDLGSAGPGWVRTGDNFTAFAPGIDAVGFDVCRFYTFGANSHFYTAFADECNFLKSPASGWVYEELSFRIQLPVSQACPSGTLPVYRLYNNRFAFNDSNHRFTTRFAEVAPLEAQGWRYEGVAFCARNYSGG